MLLGAELARESTPDTTIYLPCRAIIPDPPPNQLYDRTHTHPPLSEMKLTTSN